MNRAMEERCVNQNLIFEAIRNEVRNQAAELIDENKKEREQLMLKFNELEKDVKRLKNH